MGRICAGVSDGISGYQTINYYANGGTGHEVLLKGVADVGMVAVGVLGGPVGLGISIGYFVLDFETGARLDADPRHVRHRCHSRGGCCVGRGAGMVLYQSRAG